MIVKVKEGRRERETEKNIEAKKREREMERNAERTGEGLKESERGGGGGGGGELEKILGDKKKTRRREMLSNGVTLRCREREGKERKRCRKRVALKIGR